MAKNSKNEKDGEKHPDEIIGKIKPKHKELAERIESRKENYLTFLDYPEEIRTHT
jgi:transposase-like protein